MCQPFRLLVTGSRTWTDVRTIEQALTVIVDRRPGGVLLVHGACPRGADVIAAAYAARTPGYWVEAHPADWHRYGRAAGYRRNAEMIALGAAAVPCSSETAARISLPSCCQDSRGAVPDSRCGPSPSPCANR